MGLLLEKGIVSLLWGNGGRGETPHALIEVFVLTEIHDVIFSFCNVIVRFFSEKTCANPFPVLL